MTSFAGWQMPLRYASETAEHLAVRHAAGLFDLSHMGEIAVAGPGAGAVLDYALTGTLSALRPGRARYTMICAEDGGVLDDLVVYRLDEDEFLVIANASNTDVVLAALRDLLARPGKCEKAERQPLGDVCALPPAGQRREIMRRDAGDRRRRIRGGRHELDAFALEPQHAHARDLGAC